jgi:hypothetical protein
MRPDDDAIDLTVNLRDAKCGRSGSAIKQLGFFDIPAELLVARPSS